MTRCDMAGERLIKENAGNLKAAYETADKKQEKLYEAEKHVDKSDRSQGRIHSIESFGTVDGPGIRLVVFFQGCPLRCRYCHNPDSWDVTAGTRMTVNEILTLYEKNKSFYRKGGITATGGEPLLQLEFLTQLFAEAKRRGIHTCLDTSGIVYRDDKKEDYVGLFNNLDLVLLDIKHSETKEHRELTGQKMEPVLAFARALEKARLPMIVRHVVVPGITDGEKHLKKLGRLLGTFTNLKGLEVLPYHTMGVKKYESMGMIYPLAGVPPMGADEAGKARNLILEGMREERKRKKQEFSSESDFGFRNYKEKFGLFPTKMLY